MSAMALRRMTWRMKLTIVSATNRQACPHAAEYAAKQADARPDLPFLT